MPYGTAASLTPDSQGPIPSVEINSKGRCWKRVCGPVHPHIVHFSSLYTSRDVEGGFSPPECCCRDLAAITTVKPSPDSLLPISLPSPSWRSNDVSAAQGRARSTGASSVAGLPGQCAQLSPAGGLGPSPSPPAHMGCNSEETHIRGTGRTLRDFFNIFGKGEPLIF